MSPIGFGGGSLKGFENMQNIIDHVGRATRVPIQPTRIISLCPAITVTLFELGLQEKVVGRTRFCIYPQDKVHETTIVGGTKDIKIETIRALKPDLIIAEKEENTKEIVTQLEQEFPVFVFEVQSIHANKRMIQDLGKLVHHDEEANSLITKIDSAFKNLPDLHGKKAAYMIWRTPHMVVGNATYINSVLGALNLVNPFTTFEGRYPIVTIEDLQQAKLDYLFLATEPFRFKNKHVEEFSNQLQDVQVSLIDGEMFWYGVHMIEGANYLKEKFK